MTQFLHIAIVSLVLIGFFTAGAIVGFWSGVRRTWAAVDRICDESGFAALVRKVDQRKGAKHES